MRGQNGSFYWETLSTSNNIGFIRLRNLTRNSVHYSEVCDLPLRGRTHVRIKGQNLNLYLDTHATPHNIHATPNNIYFIRPKILPRILVHYTGVCDWPLKPHPYVSKSTQIPARSRNYLDDTHSTSKTFASYAYKI